MYHPDFVPEDICLAIPLDDRKPQELVWLTLCIDQETMTAINLGRKFGVDIDQHLFGIIKTSAEGRFPIVLKLTYRNQWVRIDQKRFWLNGISRPREFVPEYLRIWKYGVPITSPQDAIFDLGLLSVLYDESGNTVVELNPFHKPPLNHENTIIWDHEISSAPLIGTENAKQVASLVDGKSHIVSSFKEMFEAMINRHPFKLAKGVTFASLQHACTTQKPQSVSGCLSETCAETQPTHPATLGIGTLTERSR